MRMPSGRPMLCTCPSRIFRCFYRAQVLPQQSPPPLCYAISSGSGQKSDASIPCNSPSQKAGHASGQAPTKPICLAIMGPSGVGKDSLMHCLVKMRPMHIAVSATTRPARKGEVNGQDYHFVSRQEFEAWQQQGLLLERTELYGELFGLPSREIQAPLAAGLDVVARVDWRGVLALKSRGFCPVVAVYVAPESSSQLEARLMARNADSLEKIAMRLQAASTESPLMLQAADHVLVNKEGCLEETAAQLLLILNAARGLQHPP